MFFLVLAAHTVATPFWWQALCDALIAVVVAGLFVSNGLSLATCSMLIQRPPGWWERVGLASGVVGGSGFAFLGILTACVILKRFVLDP